VLSRCLTLMMILPAFSLPAEGVGQRWVDLDSVDVGISNDFPVGDYQSKSAYNLGVSAQLNGRLTQAPNFYPFVEVDNNYWLVTPDWIHFGTQINVLVGVGALYPLPVVEGLGVFSLGGALGYGLMSHFVRANTSGSGDTFYSFFDQAVEVQLQTQLRLQSFPLTLLLTPRFFFSPEQNGKKYEFGFVTGVRFPLGSGQ